MADSYSVKKITELTENTTSHDTDLFVLGNEGTSTMRKVSFANLAAWVKTKLNALVSSDIVNNATTSDSSKVASAAVAKSLQDQITTLNSNLGNLYSTSGSLSYVSGEGNLNTTKRAVEAGIIPKGKPFVVNFTSGSEIFVTGYVYPNGLYGAGITCVWNQCIFWRINNGTWTQSQS